MPIKECTKNGKQGIKYGDKGKCYTGKEKSKAYKQMTAIKKSGYKEK